MDREKSVIGARRVGEILRGFGPLDPGSNPGGSVKIHFEIPFTFETGHKL